MIDDNYCKREVFNLADHSELMKINQRQLSLNSLDAEIN